MRMAARATGSNNDDSTSIDLSTQPPQSIPTLQEWAMVLLALLLGGLAMQQRRQGNPPAPLTRKLVMT